MSDALRKALVARGYAEESPLRWYLDLPPEEGGHLISFDQLSVHFSHRYPWACQVNTNCPGKDGLRPTCCVIHFDPRETCDVAALEARLLAGLAAMEAAHVG